MFKSDYPFLLICKNSAWEIHLLSKNKKAIFFRTDNAALLEGNRAACQSGILKREIVHAFWCFSVTMFWVKINIFFYSFQ